MLHSDIYAFHIFIYLQPSTVKLKMAEEALRAFIFDIGQESIRIGFAGDEVPLAAIPSMFGVLEQIPETTSGRRGSKYNDDAIARGTYFFDTNNLYVAHEGMQVSSFLEDSMINNWDAFEKLLDYIYYMYMRSDPSDHPVLVSEPPWNNRDKRETLTEILFEKYNVPAFYLAKNAMLVSFLYGMQTSIVVDSGASQTSAVPIVEGYTIANHVAKSSLAGDFLSMQCKQHLEGNQIDVVPNYMVSSKKTVARGERPMWSKGNRLPIVTKSWHDYMTKRCLNDFKSILEIYNYPYMYLDAKNTEYIHYEFPNGYNDDYGYLRYLIPETLFDTSYINDDLSQYTLGIPQVVLNSIEMFPHEIRKELLKNIITTGGNSMIKGFSDRLYQELQDKMPPTLQVDIIRSYDETNQRFGSWIGGSNLAAQDYFQGLWMSNKDYGHFS